MVPALALQRDFLGYTELDRRLYLPESWFDEDHQTRWQDCQIPDEIAFQTRHELYQIRLNNDRTHC